MFGVNFTPYLSKNINVSAQQKFAIKIMSHKNLKYIYIYIL